jgi:hypothetical protein
MNQHPEPLDKRDVETKISEYSRWISGKDLSLGFPTTFPAGSDDNFANLREPGLRDSLTQWIDGAFDQIEAANIEVSSVQVVKEFAIRA